MALFEFGWFTSSSRFILPYKIDCDFLTKDDLIGLAKIISNKFQYSTAIGVPRGGLALAEELNKYKTEGFPILIVDDVLTTGNSMNKIKKELELEWQAPKPFPNIYGITLFNRGRCPNWVHPLFNVNNLFQTRATGLNVP